MICSDDILGSILNNPSISRPREMVDGLGEILLFAMEVSCEQTSVRAEDRRLPVLESCKAIPCDDREIRCTFDGASFRA